MQAAPSNWSTYRGVRRPWTAALLLAAVLNCPLSIIAVRLSRNQGSRVTICGCTVAAAVAKVLR